MRSILLAAVAALTVAGVTNAEVYKLDAKGGCHDSHGKYAAKTFCVEVKPKPKQCRDPKNGHFIKCLH